MVDALAAALAPRLARLVADLVVEELGYHLSAPAPVVELRPPLTAREVMVRLGRSYDYVRDHRGELGVLPVDGARPRLLFDAEAVERFARERAGGGDAAIERRRSPAPDPPVATGKRRRRRCPRLGTDVPLLPVGGPQGGR